jgi:PhnB protein
MLKSNSLILMGTDVTGPDVLSSGNDVALALHGTEIESMKNLFLKLSLNGEILEQWSLKPWGDYFGMIRDRFGKRWMLNFSPQNYEQ